MSSSFGTLFKVSTFGESHCAAVGGIVDGCPSKIELSEQDIQPQLDRRRPGQSDLSTPRSEKDQVQILSGVENGMTLGTAIAFMVFNKDQRPGDYKEMAKIPRPSHADFTYQQKYGVRASSGGGRASARETIARVCAGAIAEKVLKLKCGIEIVAWVSSVGNVQMPDIDFKGISRNEVDADFTRCPDMETAKKMENLILETKQQQDSVGGVISCVIRNCPAGLGEPVFEKFEALLAQAMLSIPASKGFEIGSGFAGSRMTGSQHNDMFVKKGNRLGTVTNLSGGVQGGITNGEPVYFKVAFKPPATIGRQQETSDFEGNPQVLESKGRHDPCVAARAVPVVESMAAIVTADCFFRQQYRI